MKSWFRGSAIGRGLGRLALRVGLPALVVMAAAVIARAYDTTWIKSGAPMDAVTLKAMFDEIQSRFAGTAPCPVGYTQKADPTFTICVAGLDEMVKVGSGPASFWIDRYEASVWQMPGGMGMQYGGTDGSGNLIPPDYPSSFPKNGQRVPAWKDLYAVSKTGVPPSGSITWFQAEQACRASGKRLPTDQEWQAAASGTEDRDGPCQINGANKGPRPTGGSFCLSAWGAQDMIGNVWEWTAGWWAGLGAATTNTTWPDTAGSGGTYNGDGTWNITSSADKGSGNTVGIPAAARRGGGWDNGTLAGVFALDLVLAPSSRSTSLGFRCAARGP